MSPVELEVRRLEDLGVSHDARLLRASGRAWAAAPLQLAAPVLVAGNARVPAVADAEMSAGPTGPVWSADFRVPASVAAAAERWAVETETTSPVARAAPAFPDHGERPILGGRPSRRVPDAAPDRQQGADRLALVPPPPDLLRRGRPQSAPTGAPGVLSEPPRDAQPTDPAVAAWPESARDSSPSDAPRSSGVAAHAPDDMPRTISRLEGRVAELAEVAGRTRAADARRVVEAEARAAAADARVREAEEVATVATRARARAEASLRTQAADHAAWVAEQDERAVAHADALRRLDVALAERDEARARVDVALAERDEARARVAIAVAERDEARAGAGAFAAPVATEPPASLEDPLDPREEASPHATGAPSEPIRSAERVVEMQRRAAWDAGFSHVSPEPDPPSATPEPATEAPSAGASPAEAPETPAWSEEAPARLEEPPGQTDEAPQRTEEPPAQPDEAPQRTEEPPAQPDDVAQRTEEPTARSEEPAARSDETPQRTEEPAARSEEELQPSGEPDEVPVQSEGSPQQGGRAWKAREEPLSPDHRPSEAPTGRAAPPSSPAGGRARPGRRRVGLGVGVLAGAGALLSAEAITTAIWQEPLSAVYAAQRQSSLRTEERELTTRLRRDTPSQRPDQSAAGRMAELAVGLRGEIEPGDAIGRLRIPRVDGSWVVVQGSSPDQLRAGPGHAPGSSLPGRQATTALTGRVATFGAAFRDLDELRPGDEIGMEMPYGSFVYRVESSETLSRAAAARAEAGQGEARLVLTAPASRLGGDELRVVSARQVEATPRGPAA